MIIINIKINKNNYLGNSKVVRKLLIKGANRQIKVLILLKLKYIYYLLIKNY